MIFVSAQNGNDSHNAVLGNFETNIGPDTVFFASDVTS